MILFWNFAPKHITIQLSLHWNKHLFNWAKMRTAKRGLKLNCNNFCYWHCYCFEILARASVFYKNISWQIVAFFKSMWKVIFTNAANISFPRNIYKSKPFYQVIWQEKTCHFLTISCFFTFWYPVSVEAFIFFSLPPYQAFQSLGLIHWYYVWNASQQIPLEDNL